MSKILMKRYGGKVYLSKWIINHFPEHEIYVEPFAGSAAVLFKKSRSKNEFINDLDDELMNAYRVAQSNPYELAAQLWLTPYCNANWREQPINDIEKAAKYIAKTQQFYAGATGSSTFSVDNGHANKSKSKVWADWFKRVLPAFVRLKDVTILNECALKTISRFADNEKALIYVDPPYVGHENEYSYCVDYEQMAKILRSAKAKVIVSGYANCADYWLNWSTAKKPSVTRASIGRHKMKAKTNTEMLFMNYTKEIVGGSGGK